MAVPSDLFAQEFVSIPFSSGGQVKQTLEKTEKDYESNKGYRKISKITKSFFVKRKKLYKLHEKHQGEVKYMYQKNMTILESRAPGKKSNQLKQLFWIKWLEMISTSTFDN